MEYIQFDTIKSPISTNINWESLASKTRVENIAIQRHFVIYLAYHLSSNINRATEIANRDRCTYYHSSSFVKFMLEIEHEKAEELLLKLRPQVIQKLNYAPISECDVELNSVVFA